MSTLPIPTPPPYPPGTSYSDYLLREMFLWMDGSDSIDAAQIEARLDLDRTIGCIQPVEGKRVTRWRKPQPPHLYQADLVFLNAYQRYEDTVGTDDYPADCVEVLVVSLLPVIYSICRQTRGQVTQDDYLEAVERVCRGLYRHWRQGKPFDFWAFHDRKGNLAAFSIVADEPTLSGDPYYRHIFTSSHEVDPLLEQVREWVRSRLRALNRRDRIVQDENLATQVSISSLRRPDYAEDEDGVGWESQIASGSGDDTATLCDSILLELRDAAESLAGRDREIAILLITSETPFTWRAIAERYQVKERAAKRYLSEARKNLKKAYFPVHSS